MFVDDDAPTRSHRLSWEGASYAVVAYVPEALHLPDRLTRCEAEVVRMVCDGSSNADIASRRGVSVRTVANQLAAVFRKLGVGSRSELLVLVHRRSLTKRSPER